MSMTEENRRVRERHAIAFWVLKYVSVVLGVLIGVFVFSVGTGFDRVMGVVIVGVNVLVGAWFVVSDGGIEKLKE